MLMPRPSPLTRISRDAAGIIAYEDLPKVILTLRVKNHWSRQSPPFMSRDPKRLCW